MNLQLALDRLTKEECLSILEETKDYIDWIEVGTGVIKEYGMDIVRTIKARYPEKIVVTDMKTCDAGRHEALQAFEAGADITTVMAFSSDQTIIDTLTVAKEHNKTIMLDLLGITDRKRIQELAELGVELVSLHVGKDMQKSQTFNESLFSLVKGFANLKVAVAGGINEKSLPSIVKERPLTVIVGSAITKAENRKEAAAIMKGLIAE